MTWLFRCFSKAALATGASGCAESRKARRGWSRAGQERREALDATG